MKAYDYELCGRRVHLCMNGAALLDCYDHFGQETELLKNIEGNSKKSFRNTCWMLAKFAEQGELVRRYQGYKDESIPNASFFEVNLSPLGIAEAKAIVRAVAIAGFKQTEKEEDEAIDLGLQELEKKTAKIG